MKGIDERYYDILYDVREARWLYIKKRLFEVLLYFFFGVPIGVAGVIAIVSLFVIVVWSLFDPHPIDNTIRVVKFIIDTVHELTSEEDFWKKYLIFCGIFTFFYVASDEKFSATYYNFFMAWHTDHPKYYKALGIDYNHPERRKLLLKAYEEEKKRRESNSRYSNDNNDYWYWTKKRKERWRKATSYSRWQAGIIDKYSGRWGNRR